MLKSIMELDQVIGTCERLVSTPVPPAYTRFTSRILLAWLACVPLSLAGIGLPNVAIVMGTFFTSCIMIGLDEIAIQIEEPMRLLPLFDLCNLIMSDVSARLAPEEQGPSYKIHASCPSSSRASARASIHRLLVCGMIAGFVSQHGGAVSVDS
jgi:predicted membrane chloride channel (bestrophin family)